MNHATVFSALAECEKQIRAWGVTEPVRLPEGASYLSLEEAHPYPRRDTYKYRGLAHCLALCVEAQTWSEERREKAMRWLCWIQGVMWTLTDVDIATLKNMNKPDPEVVHVHAAIIIRDGRILLTQTRGAANYPFSWESPGGKSLPNETPKETLGRELLEELDLRGVYVGRMVWSGSLPMTLRGVERVVDLTMWQVSTLEHLVPKEGQGLGWFSVSEMVALNLSPANRAALTAVVGAIREESGQ